jgi:hypothetical protein
MFLLSLPVILTIAVLVGVVRVIGIQTRILSPDIDTQLSLILGRSSMFTKPTFPLFISGMFQENLEQALGDSLPFLEQTIQFLNDWKSRAYEISLGVLPGSWSPVLPVGAKGYIAIQGKERLLPTPATYSVAIIKQMNEVAEYYSKISTRWPQVRFYVFSILASQQVFAETGAWSAISTKLLLGSKAVEELEALLRSSVTYSWAGKGRSALEVLDFYYNTDHHFTMLGAYEVYRQVHRLISTRVDIGKDVLCLKWFVVSDVVFQGSHSRRSGGYKGPTDKIVDGLFALPQYNIRIHGVKAGQQRNKRAEYLAGKIPSGRFINHYGEYFGKDHGLIEYVVDQVLEGRNLLVIGNSFKNCMEPLLSAHFRHSYFVDLRYYEYDMRQSFDLDTFISKKGITDVLFLGSEWIALDLTRQR